MHENIRNSLWNFYQKNLETYGSNAQGVGWRDEDAQLIRFGQLMQLVSINESFSINDLGCGVGDLASYLEKKCSFDFYYKGYDVLQEMIIKAEEKHAPWSNRKFYLIDNADGLDKADFTVASGIFNLRYTTPDEQWLSYITQTLNAIDEKSSKGFAFNALTKYSDPEKMQDYLYYADPLYLFDYCKRHFSKNVALLHDYNLYDFTILVRKKV